MTRAFRQSGQWAVAEALEAFPRGKYDVNHDIVLDGIFKRLCREAKRARNQHWHFAVPCSSFSVMNVNMNRGTRSNSVPAGNS